MPIAQHAAWDIKTYHKGANRDVEAEFIGALRDGECIDNSNMRPASKDGHAGAIEKISGEEELFANIGPLCILGNDDPLPGNYLCIGSTEVNDHIVEFWADEDKVEASLIRIDGDVVLKSPKFGITADHILQIAKNESCIGGEVYTVDFNIPPLFFNIQQLIDKKCTQENFDDYDPLKNTIILKVPLDHPAFIELVSSGSQGSNTGVADRVITQGGGGMGPGTYQYRIRYSTVNGDRTKLSVATPPIPVLQNLRTESDQYPFVMRRGSTTSITGQTTFGIKIRFRVTNLQDFDFIEVARISYNSESPISTLSTTDIIAKVEVDNDEVAIIDFIDRNADVIETITEAEETEQLRAVAVAKAIRYFKQRLYLMNIKFESRDLEDQITFLDGIAAKIYPTIENIGKDGHKDPFKHTYFKSYMHGEKYGYAAVFFDKIGERSFGVPVKDGENFQMPNRRKLASADTLKTVSNGDGFNKTVLAVTSDNNSTGLTHEVFDLKEAVRKRDTCSFINIYDREDAIISGDGLVGKSADLDKYCDSSTRPSKNASGRVTPGAIGYKPFHPTKQDDSNVIGHDYRVNTAVHDGNGFIDVNDINFPQKAFGPRYFSLGIAIEGLDNIPDWVEAFSIVRTEAAGRVVAQGLGFYALKEADFNIIGNAGLAGKELNSVWFHSDDIQNGFVPPETIDDIKANPNDFRIQLVSPLGFFSEVYSFQNRDVDNRDDNIDLISYVRIIREDGNINVGDFITDIGIGGFIQFDKWRNKAAPSPADANFLYTITDFKDKVEGRQTEGVFELTLNASIYQTPFTGGTQLLHNNTKFNATGMKNWTEPMYIMNLLNDTLNVPQKNIDEYVETGHYQKINSIIGRSDGSNSQEYFLVDERWEDCIPDANDPNVANIDKVILVEIPDVGTKLYLNITFKPSAQDTIIRNAIINNGFFTDNKGRKIEGMFDSHSDINIFPAEKRIFKIHIGNFNYAPPNNAPPLNSLIRVKYDNTTPIRIFGGDTTIGESIFAPLDGKSVQNGIQVQNRNLQFQFGIGFPYLKYELNPRYYQVNRTTGTANFIMDKEEVKLAVIRQMIAMYTVSSRADMTKIFHDPTADESFAMKHYTVRPHRWDDNKTMEKNRMFQSYIDDYADTATGVTLATSQPSGEWSFGGFKFLPLINQDYSHVPLAQQHSSKPKVGFEEETSFCTRIIWSEIRPPNVVDSPGLRTFLEESRFDIEDSQGEIKFAWDGISQRGSNLYAVCDSGVCLLMTDKRVLSDANATELAIIGTDATETILEQIWISKDIGMHDEMWRSTAEYKNALWFANHNSAYKLENDTILDIGRLNYHSKLYDKFLRNINPGFDTPVSSNYDRLHDEYWLNICLTGNKKLVVKGAGLTTLFDEITDIKTGDIIDVTEQLTLPQPPASLPVELPNALTNGIAEFIFVCNETTFIVGLLSTNPLGVIINLQPGECAKLTSDITNAPQIIWQAELTEKDLIRPCKTLVFGEDLDPLHWIGTYDYKFDNFLSFKNRSFGFRDLTTFELHKGFQINGSNIEGVTLQASAMNQINGKEFIRFRVATDVKPTRIEFFDTVEQADNNDVQAVLDTDVNPLALKDYRGFEQYIPRKTNGAKNRMQGRMLVFKVVHNKAEHFKIVDTAVQFKLIK